MAKVQFDTATVQATIDSRQRAVLSVVYSTGLSPSAYPAPLKGFPLTLYDVDAGSYSLGVVIEPAVTTSLSSPVTMMSRQLFLLGSKDNQNYLMVEEMTSEPTDRDDTVVWRGMPLAVNASGSLILTNSGLSPTAFDEEHDLFHGSNTLTVRRYGSRWYLVVAEV
jgi:hypothetical protein